LKAHNDTSDDAFFTRRGFKSARDFHAQYLHLSATIILGETAAFVSNREARRPIAKDVEFALTTCLSAASP
jgi:hypothetical protein